jgi:hypothetical protein
VIALIDCKQKEYIAMKWIINSRINMIPTTTKSSKIVEQNFSMLECVNIDGITSMAITRRFHLRLFLAISSKLYLVIGNYCTLGF